MKDIQKAINECFINTFGRTPQRQRLHDIFEEALELRNATDYTNLKEETGDLLALTIQLCNECEWDAEELIKNTLGKIKRREKQYLSLGRKIKVAILGGAFNPPTIGHIKLAQFVLNTSKTFDEVWLTPCFSHMYNKKMESFEHRLAMCEMMAKLDGRIRVFGYEGEKKLGGETYHFVKTLLGEEFAKDKYDFSLIIGQDNANTFNKWVNYEDLEKMIRFVVVPRQGEVRDIESDWYLKAPHIYLCGETNIPETSSTEIRHLLSRMKFLDETCYGLDHNEIAENIVGKTSEEVFNYIQTHKLYQN
ncbi:hypothetical protein D4R86_05145 [bacterium]|nr:MAG: hypothetical protein D4R86_05145 [bacterium]